MRARCSEAAIGAANDLEKRMHMATTPRALAGAAAFDEAIGGWDDASKTMDTKVSAVRKDIGGWYTSSLTHVMGIYDAQTFDEAIGGSDRSKWRKELRVRHGLLLPRGRLDERRRRVAVHRQRVVLRHARRRHVLRGRRDADRGGANLNL